MALTRRWCERLRQAAAAEQLPGVASVRLGERDAIPGTALARPFPGAVLLLAAGYACREDLPTPDLDGLDDARAELERVDDLESDTLDAILTNRGFDPTDES